MATYTANGQEEELANLNLKLSERHLYSSSRLGILTEEIDVDNNNTGPVEVEEIKLISYYRGYCQYELSNHLGNVLATVSDKKFGIDNNDDEEIDYFEPEIITASDYYPFGMLMPGRGGSLINGQWQESGPEILANLSVDDRTGNQPSEYLALESIEFLPGFESGNADEFVAYITTSGTSGGYESENGLYRYGFNGKEMDNETGTQDYGFRIYNPGLGRFLSVDPITVQYPELTPYQFASNRPIDGIDLDGLEWYYSNNIFDQGWKMSISVKPPPIMANESFKQEYYNKLGYLTTDQKNAVQLSRDKFQERQNRIRAVQDWNASILALNKSRNLFYLAYELSPASALVNSYSSFNNGNTFNGVLNLALGIGGLAELRSLGLGKFSTFSDLFDVNKLASVKINEIWKIPNNFIRGTLIENKLAQTIYKGYEHLGSSVSKYFKYIDFYDEISQIGISLKSVNAKSNFNFRNIMKNIDDLAFAKNAGSIVSNGTERIIKDVRLDIVIPKGYDRGVLNKVEKYANHKKVKINIFEVE